MAKITMADGTVFEGSVEEFAAMAKAMGVTAEEADEVKAGAPEAKEPTEPFKVGDYVKVVNNSGTSKKIGEITQLTIVGDNNVFPYEDDKSAFGDRHIVHASQEEIDGYLGISKPTEALSHELSKGSVAPAGYVKIPNELAKEGDLVKAIDVEDYDVLSGATYEIEAIDEDGDYEIIANGEDSYVCVEVDEFEIYRKPIEGAPQVGDKILVTAVLPISARYYDNGDVLTVKRIDSDGDTYVNRRILHLKRREFVIIERPAEAPAEESTEIEVGDIVRVVDSPSALPNGTLFAVAKVSSSGNVFDDSREGYVYMAPHNQLEIVAKAADRRDISRKDV